MLQGVGPDLTAQNFQDALFAAARPPEARDPASLISYGNKGIWPETDYMGIDDATEIWWNPDATGPDELQRSGTGMYEYVDGGKRYLPGRVAVHPPDGVRPQDAVTSTRPSRRRAVPSYPSPRRPSSLAWPERPSALRHPGAASGSAWRPPDRGAGRGQGSSWSRR